MIDWKLEKKEFWGELSIKDHRLNVQFKLEVPDTGDAVIELARIPQSKEMEFIENYFEQGGSRFSEFTLSGEASDNTKFLCDNVIVTSLSSDFFTGSICPKIDYSSFKIESLSIPKETPVVKWNLRGFKSFRKLSASTELGTLEMIGDANADKTGSITGSITVQATSQPTQISQWRDEVEKLVRHVRNIMSFASGNAIAFPVCEFSFQSQTSIEVLSQESIRGNRGFFLIPNETLIHSPPSDVYYIWIRIQK